MSTLKSKYKNLVFEGGGVKGAAYAGCIEVMHKHGLLEGVEQVGGTSAGSITAALLAIGAGSEGLTSSVKTSKFSQFISDPGGIFMDIYRVFRYYGVHSGNRFAQILKGYIKQYTGNPDLTFAQLSKKVEENPQKFKHLSVLASNITMQQMDVFNSVNTPDVPIWQAVRCSMSIPFVFEPFQIEDNFYMDGGLGWIYPIDLYDKKDSDGGDIRNEETLGFFLEPHHTMHNISFKPQKVAIHSIKSAATAMMDFLYNASNSKHIHPEDKARTVFIDDLGIHSTDFGILEVEIEQLIESGRAATIKFLNTM